LFVCGQASEAVGEGVGDSKLHLFAIAYDIKRFG
jgi:hypothetical protein